MLMLSSHCGKVLVVTLVTTYLVGPSTCWLVCVGKGVFEDSGVSAAYHRNVERCWPIHMNHTYKRLCDTPWLSADFLSPEQVKTCLAVLSFYNLCVNCGFEQESIADCCMYMCSFPFVFSESWGIH